MSSQIVLKLKPEEDELFRKRQEFAAVQATLAERELDLTELSRQLSAFESLYVREVGVLYAELDLWNARIAEWQAQVAPSSRSAQRARTARKQARETHEAAQGQSSRAPNFDPSPELKRLFREVAKRFHPDLGRDEADYGRRTKLMAEANRAYRAADAESLQAILDAEEYSCDSPELGERLGTQLVRVIRQISRAKERVHQIELDLERLRKSELALLMADANKAQELGRDLIAELSAKVTAEIRVAREHYEAVIRKR